MGIVDYLSRKPTGEPWPESVLDEKFVVTSVECFHKAVGSTICFMPTFYAYCLFLEERRKK